MKIVLRGEFPTLNEVIGALNTQNRQVYARMKRKYTNATVWDVKSQKVPKIDFKIDVAFTWYRKNKRTDPDNITVGQKFILDALVVAGVLKNDGWNEINSINHVFKVDKDNPRVEITISEHDDA